MPASLSRADKSSAMMDLLVAVAHTPLVRPYLLQQGTTGDGSDGSDGSDGGLLVRAVVGCLVSTGDAIVEQRYVVLLLPYL